MFYYINGELTALEPNFAVIDAGGVGYKLTISQTTYYSLASFFTTTEPHKVKLFTHMAVREDDVELYGFYAKEELSTFKLLITVSGVGPKAALSILSLLTPDKFAIAVCSEDVKLISKANGVGAKTAARIVLELRDKMQKASGSFVGKAPSSLGSPVPSQTAGNGKLAEAQDALMVLGYTRAEAQNALRTIDTSSLELEEIIKQALKLLMR